MKGFIKLVAILILVLISSLTLLAFLAIDKHSSIEKVNVLDSQSAKQAKQSVKRIYQSLTSTDEVTQLIITPQELNGLMSLAHRALPSLKVQVNVIDGIAQFTFSQALPVKGYFANVSTVVYSSDKGLALGDTSIGSLSFSGNWLLGIIEWALNLYIEGDFGSELLATVKTVNIQTEQITLHYQLPDTLGSGPDGASRLLKLRDELSLFGDAKGVRFYFQHLVEFAQDSQSHELADYLNYSLQTAYYNTAIKRIELEKVKQKSLHLAKNESHSALMALVLYFGHDKLELLIGDVIDLSPKEARLRHQLQNSVKLASRVDLQKHFIYSMALQLVANLTTSDAIGEFKELLDANLGGSGFSFADLLADKAGTRFAKMATQNEKTAEKLQQYFAQPVAENAFMPIHLDLPEGISEQDFKLLYNDINSAQYQTMVQAIEARLLALPVYH